MQILLFKCTKVNYLLTLGSKTTTKLWSEMLGLGFYNSFSKLSYHLASRKLWPIFLGGTGGKEPTYQCRRCNRSWFDPWVEKAPWRKAWQPTPVFLPGESHGQRAWQDTVHGVTRSQTLLKGLSAHKVGQQKKAGRWGVGRKRKLFLCLPIPISLTPRAIIFFQPQDILSAPRIDPQSLL